MPRWTGSREVQESQDSPEWDFQSGKALCTRTFAGPYDKCLSSRPACDAGMTGMPAGYLVTGVKVKKASGGRGIVTVSLEYMDLALTEKYGPPEYEVDWTQLEKAIEKHKRYWVIEDFTGADPPKEVPAGVVLTQADADRVAVYFAAATKDERKKAHDDLKALTSNSGKRAFELLKKKIRGQESFIVPAPVVRRTRTCNKSPQTSACGKIEAPPVAAQPPTGYIYLKTADRGTRSGTHGRWKRTEEWTGAEEWDTDIYETATP